MKEYMPEQMFKSVLSNEYKQNEIRTAFEKDEILEAQAIKCDKELNLEVKLGTNIRGIIPFSEFQYSTDGKPVKSVAVISKVGKSVQFKITEISKTKTGMELVLSRKAAQKECYDNFISKLTVGKVISARATHIEKYGAFCDIGCGIIALLPVENICTTRINNPKESLKSMNNLKVIVSSIENGKITLTHKELLGTWEQEAAKFEPGDTVVGTVRIVEEYGVFVQLTPNLVGLADSYPDIAPGDRVTVYVKSIYKDKMKVKLMILAKNEPTNEALHFDYKLPESGFVKDWYYSPPEAERKIESHLGE